MIVLVVVAVAVLVTTMLITTTVAVCEQIVYGSSGIEQVIVTYRLQILHDRMFLEGEKRGEWEQCLSCALRFHTGSTVWWSK
jgi:hypothetical protein